MAAARVSFSDVPWHEMVSVEPVGVVREQMQGVMDEYSGHLQRTSALPMAVRKGVFDASPHVGAPLAVEM